MKDLNELLKGIEHDGSYIPVNCVKLLMDNAYNQCLLDLIEDDILPDKTINFIKYSK